MLTKEVLLLPLVLRALGERSLPEALESSVKLGDEVNVRVTLEGCAIGGISHRSWCCFPGSTPG